MAYYSHSKLETFKQCRLKYKFQYIDKIRVPSKYTIELFMGDMVHRALYILYVQMGEGKKPILQDIISYFINTWDGNWKDDIICNKGRTPDDYKKIGVDAITKYFVENEPFDQYTIVGLETQDRLHLPNGSSYAIRIDKLAKDTDGTYYVTDYKTNARAKTQDELAKDRQLAMYGLWVQKNFADCNKVKLVWNFVVTDNTIILDKTEQELQHHEKEVLDTISQIETAADYPPNKTRLCDWCPYKSQCPAWNEKRLWTKQVTLGGF